MATPAWLAATVGQPAKAGQCNQFLGAHSVTYLYQGGLHDSQTTPGSGGVAANGIYMAQKFTTGSSQGAVGYAAATISTSGGAGTTMTLSVYASSGGAPTGSPLISVAASYDYVTFAPASVVFPLPIGGLSPSTAYFLVASPSGTNFPWGKSNQVTGAYTSTNGTSWTAQAYGLLYQIYDQAATGPLTCTWEDAGARWTWLQTTSGQITELSEFTTAQNSGYLQSDRTLVYSGSTLIGVA
jgi:hypothetical protein